MAVSYPIAMPSVGGFQAVRFGLHSNTTVHTSPFTGEEQVLERAGARWVAEFSLIPMVEADADEWKAFFLRLKGRRGTFDGYDPAKRSPRGTIAGTPLVAGASQTGSELICDGFNAGDTVKAGDYFSVGGRFHMNTADGTADGGGNLTMDIAPALRESPSDNAALTFTNPTVTMRLASDQLGMWDVSAPLIYGLAFQAIEDI